MTRPFELLRTRDQWLRASHDGTSIDEETHGVKLSWTDPTAAPGTRRRVPGGLAFDGQCRLYRSRPLRGRVERILWAAQGADAPEQLDLLSGEPSVAGDFTTTRRPRPPLRHPSGLAVDEDDRLYVAETGAGRVLVLDLWSRRLLRTIRFRGAPVDLACRGRSVWALLAGPMGVARFESRSGPHRVDVVVPPPNVPPGAVPLRIAVSPDQGEPLVLLRSGDDGWIVPLDRPELAFSVAHAGDLEFAGDGSLVVGRGPRDDLLRFRLEREGVFEDTPLHARGYDGRGLVRDPNGDVGFWTNRGFRPGVPARVEYAPRGRVYTYRLDSGEFQTEWGRVFVDACIPAGAELRLHCATADEPGDEETILRAPPVNATNAHVTRPDLSPPLVPVSLAPPLGAAGQPLHRRETGRELPWARPERGDPFVTYEAPVIAPPGRYLWLAFDLSGTLHASPRIKSVRVEHPSHDLMRRLPRAFSRDEAAADFLRRYLAIFDGALGELEDKSVERHVLVDPDAAPVELLPWVASFLGLTLDEHWDEPTRRRLIARAAGLFRFRGTVCGVQDFLELVLGTRVLVVEHYRFRGLGGAMLNDSPTGLYAGTIVGSTLRVGGELGAPGSAPLEGTVADSFTAHAHRFTVVVPAELTDVQRRMAEYVLEVHRPAHTVFEICTVGAGMRVGKGLHVGMLSTIGRTGGFSTLQLGASALGRGAIVGRPERGGRLGESQLDETTRVG